MVIMNEKPLRWEEDVKNTFNVGNGGVCDGSITIPSVFVSYESRSALLEMARSGLCVVGARGRDAENPVGTRWSAWCVWTPFGRASR